MKATLWYCGFNEAQLKDIASRFEKLLDCKLEFQNIYDKSLIGGFIAHIDGTAYDASCSSRLKTMRSYLNTGDDEL